MYLVYLGEVLKRAFTPAPRLTDGLQVAAASALPAAASFAGADLPTSAQGDALAYIGLVVVSYFVIRLFWAPYAMWKEQSAEICVLKLELTKPERLVLEHLSKHRARAIIKLQKELSNLHARTFATDPWEDAKGRISIKLHSFRARISQAGFPEEVFIKIARFMYFCGENRPKGEGSRLIAGLDERAFLEQCVRVFNGQVRPESLELQLPQGTERETPL